MTLVFLIIFLSSIIFMMLNHPLTFGGILLTQTICISMLTGLMNYNYWFSYILFLIMIGGMLILFIYMTSVASNEKFKFQFKLFFFSMLFIFTLILMILFTDNYFNNFMKLNFDMTNQSLMFLNNLSMNKYMNLPSIFITMILIIYLFITLIAIVKITEIQYGPMRKQKKYYVNTYP